MTDNEIRLPDEIWQRINEVVYTITKQAQVVPYISDPVATAGGQNVMLFLAPFESSPHVVFIRGES